MSKDEAFWLKAREQVCRDRRRINLNAGTLSPTPIPVLGAVNALRRQMAENPSDFYWRQMPGLLDRSRQSLAAYLNARPADLFLLPNTTFAINLIVASLKLPAGSEIRLDGGPGGGSAWTTSLAGLEATMSDGSQLRPPWTR